MASLFMFRRSRILTIKDLQCKWISLVLFKFDTVRDFRRDFLHAVEETFPTPISTAAFTIFVDILYS